MTVYRHEYLLIGSGINRFKSALGLDTPDWAGLKSETYWNNRGTPLPPGVYCWLRALQGQPAQLCIQSPQRPTLYLDNPGTEIGAFVLEQHEPLGLPVCQPANTCGLFADTQIQAYEECYRQDEVTFCLQQGLVYLALPHAGELRQSRPEPWLFIGAEPQATHLTLRSPSPSLKGKLRRALTAAAALPSIAPADHAQQLSRMHDWWWGGERPINLPLTAQLAPIAALEMESKLAVSADFARTSWVLRQAIHDRLLAGFTPYPAHGWVRHSHDVVRYLKGKHKLLLQGAMYRFGEKSLGQPQGYASAPSALVMIRQESKPAYRPIDSFATATAILAQAQAHKPVGDLYCHKRKFLLQSEATGGGYHVLIDHSLALAQPAAPLAQIEIECQWKKLPPRQPLADPLAVAADEIAQLTQALCAVLSGVQPTQLTKRNWLKQQLKQEGTVYLP